MATCHFESDVAIAAPRDRVFEAVEREAIRAQERLLTNLERSLEVSLG